MRFALGAAISKLGVRISSAPIFGNAGARYCGLVLYTTGKCDPREDPHVRFSVYEVYQGLVVAWANAGR